MPKKKKRQVLPGWLTGNAFGLLGLSGGENSIRRWKSEAFEQVVDFRTDGLTYGRKAVISKTGDVWSMETVEDPKRDPLSSEDDEQATDETWDESRIQVRPNNDRPKNPVLTMTIRRDGRPVFSQKQGSDFNRAIFVDGGNWVIHSNAASTYKVVGPLLGTKAPRGWIIDHSGVGRTDNLVGAANAPVAVYAIKGRAMLRIFQRNKSWSAERIGPWKELPNFREYALSADGSALWVRYETDELYGSINYGRLGNLAWIDIDRNCVWSWRLPTSCAAIHPAVTGREGLVLKFKDWLIVRCHLMPGGRPTLVADGVRGFKDKINSLSDSGDGLGVLSGNRGSCLGADDFSAWPWPAESFLDPSALLSQVSHPDSQWVRSLKTKPKSTAFARRDLGAIVSELLLPVLLRGDLSDATIRTVWHIVECREILVSTPLYARRLAVLRLMLPPSEKRFRGKRLADRIRKHLDPVADAALISSLDATLDDW